MAIASRSLFPRQRGWASHGDALTRTFFTTVLARTVLIQMIWKKYTFVVHGMQALYQISSKKIS